MKAIIYFVLFVVGLAMAVIAVVQVSLNQEVYHHVVISLTKLMVGFGCAILFGYAFFIHAKELKL